MTANHHTPIANDAPAVPATFNDPLGELDDAITKLGNGTTPITPVLTKLNLAGPAELTIASGAITVTQTRHTVDTEGNASTDDLVTINGGVEGDLILLQAEDGGRDVVIKHGTGNIYLSGTTDITLSDEYRVVALVKSGGTWCEV